MNVLKEAYLRPLVLRLSLFAIAFIVFIPNSFGDVERYKPGQVSSNAPIEPTFSPTMPGPDVAESQQKLDDSIQKTLDTWQKINDENLERSNEAIANERDAKAAQAENQLRQDLKRMIGSQAFGAKKGIDEQWTRIQDEALANLTPNQRRLLIPKLQARYQSLDRTVNLHMGEEIPKYQIKAEDDSIAGAQTKAFQNYNDPTAIQQSITLQEKAQVRKMEILGYGNDEEGIKLRTFELNKIRSQTHAGVISAMLADQQKEMALKYFNEHKDHIVSEDRNSLQERIGRKA